MNTVVIRQGLSQISQNFSAGKSAAGMALVGLFFLGDTAHEAVKTSLVDAYLQVSVFVAATLAFLFLLERIGRTNLEQVMRRFRHLQIPLAAVLGAIPGCGGAIMVTTQYIRGSMSFGGVVTVLVATMGDAAFLLLAKEPATALLVFATCFTVGIVSGLVVDAIHGRDFLRIKDDGYADEEELIVENELLTPMYYVWMACFIPGALAGLLLAFQLDPAALSTAWLGVDLVTALALTAALLSVFMWAVNPISDFRLFTSSTRSFNRRVCDTTNFVTFWVIVGYVAYELAVGILGLDLRTLFGSWLPLLPLIATLVGFIPGCGPQIVVTTLYLNGIIPLSALMANAISNDGDALFPTIVAAPRVAILATLYSGVPALIIGYGFYLLFE